jgi:hypothetical protein
MVLKPHSILCNTSGAGKTALLVNGLCRHWGFYFVAAQDTNKIGVQDLELAIDRMSEYQGWTQDAFKNPMSNNIQRASFDNEATAFKWVYKVLLTRWTIFRAFIEVAKEQNAGKLPPDIGRHWLLFQLLPDVLDGDDHPFLTFMNSRLAGVSTDDLRDMLSEFSPRGVLGSAFDSKCDIFFYVLDEAQIAGATYMGAFADVNGEIRRPVLRPIIGAWNRISRSNSIRFIVSGTGFSLSLFEMVLTSGVGKASSPWEAVYKTGDFTTRDLQKSYISRYLPPTFLSSPSGTVLVSRMFEWLRGR